MVAAVRPVLVALELRHVRGDTISETIYTSGDAPPLLRWALAAAGLLGALLLLALGVRTCGAHGTSHRAGCGERGGAMHQRLARDEDVFYLADLEAEDAAGMTPYDVAKDSGEEESVLPLKTYLLVIAETVA